MFTRKTKNNDAAEVNVVPFIDLLSVCISFLLLTAVWLQTGVMSSKQGLGTEAQAKSENKQSVWVELGDGDQVSVTTEGLKKNSKKRQMSLDELQDFVTTLKQQNPDVRTALVLPNIKSPYNNLIRAMDSLKKADFIDIGIAPL